MNKNKRVTLKSIADHLNLSVTTVSRVLNGQAAQYRIKKKPAETVQSTAKKLNYIPSHLARSLRLKRTHTIGLVIPDISNPFFSSIAKSVEIEARKVGYSIVLCDSQENTKLEIDSLQLLQSRNIDGLIICPVGVAGDHFEQLYDSSVQIVVIDRYFPQLKCPYVLSDNYNGAVNAVNYLIKNGHIIIGCIQGLQNTSVNNDRIRGYKDAHKENNLPIDNSLIVGDSFGERNGYNN